MQCQFILRSGTDNECSIYKLSDRRASVSSDGQSPKITVTLKTLATHSKYITNCIFFGSDQQVSGPASDQAPRNGSLGLRLEAQLHMVPSNGCFMQRKL